LELFISKYQMQVPHSLPQQREYGHVIIDPKPINTMLIHFPGHCAYYIPTFSCVLKVRKFLGQYFGYIPGAAAIVLFHSIIDSS